MNPDPLATLRGLLVRIAEGHAEEIPVLADFLEETGDYRAGQVRGLLPAGSRAEDLPEFLRRAAFELLRLVSSPPSLFPEWPRWSVHGRLRNGEHYLTPWGAEYTVADHRLPISGPHFPE